MNMNTLRLGIIAIFCAASTAYSQQAAPAPTGATPKPNPFLDRKSPQDPLPGLVIRGYLGGDHPPLKFPTPLVAVIKSSQEFWDVVRPLMENELRGTMDIGRIEYAASGFMLLDRDAEVRFDIGNMVCNVGGKDFGNGQYTKQLKKGKHTLELIRRGWNDGAPKFTITDAASGQPVVFHTSEALKRELARSIKVENKTLKSKLVGPITE